MQARLLILGSLFIASLLAGAFSPLAAQDLYDGAGRDDYPPRRPSTDAALSRDAWLEREVDAPPYHRPEPPVVVHERGDFLDGDYNWWDWYGDVEYGRYDDGYGDDDWYYDYYNLVPRRPPSANPTISYRDYYRHDRDPYEDYKDTIGYKLSARGTPWGFTEEEMDALFERDLRPDAGDGLSRIARGTVLRTKQVDLRGTDAKELVALLRTSRGTRLIVDLGPTRRLRQAVQTGDTISVSGRPARIGRFNTLLATMVTVDGRTQAIDRGPRGQNDAP